MFIVCTSLARVLVWVRGRVEQKHSLTFCVFGQTKSKCFSSSTFPKSQFQQSLSTYGTPFHTPNTTSSCELPHWNRAKTFYSWTQLMSQLLLSYDIPLKRKYLVCTLIPILQLVNSFSMKASYILSFTFFTLNIGWGKPEGGGASALWLIRPPVVDLAPTGCTSCSAASLPIWTPTSTLCVLHQSIWLFAWPLTPTRQVRCMCVVPRAVSSDNWYSPCLERTGHGKLRHRFQR